MPSILTPDLLDERRSKRKLAKVKKNQAAALDASQAQERPILIAVWHALGSWWWDTIDDHGGYDRFSPMGPSTSPQSAFYAAEETFDGAVAIRQFSKPDHYPVIEDLSWYKHRTR